MNTPIDTTYEPRFTSADLTKSIEEHLQELAAATDAARLSEEMLKYLETCSKFHNYSVFNTWSILFTKPDATIVAGFQKWRSMNRFVKKGEKGIPILAPIIFKEDPRKEDSKTILRGFKVVYVFDVSQTEGEPLPETPDWKSPEQNLVLLDKLVRFAESKGIAVTFVELPGDIQGVSSGGSIKISPQAGVKTVIHELGHELLKHHSDEVKLDRAICELEAESVAYVVGKHFGLQQLNSPNYIALHGATSEMLMNHLDRIRAVIKQVIDAISD